MHALEERTKSPSSSARDENSGLVRSLGLFTTVMMVVGGVIGSGIFRKPGLMASQVGSPEILLMVWVLAGVITLFGALSIAEISSVIPETGGQYVYFERLYGAFPAFLYGWAVFAVIQTGSIAAVAWVFAEYSSQFVTLPFPPGFGTAWSIHLPFIGDIFPFADLGVKLIAGTLIVFLTIVNCLGVKFGGIVQNAFTIAKIAAMALLVFGAFILPTGGSGSNLVTTSTIIHPQGWLMVAAIIAALQGAFWGYDGWNKITYIAGEVKEPQRNIPKALLYGMLIVTAIYVTINLAYAYVLPIDDMAKSRLVAADVAERCFKGGGRWIAAAVMLSTFGTTNAIILATARVFFSMARRGVFPGCLGKAHPRFHTPGASLIVQGIWSVVLLSSGSFDMLTDTTIFVSWAFYAAGAFGVFVMRRREPDTPRPYKVPGYPIVPCIFVLFAVLYLVLTVKNDLSAYHDAVAAGKPALINSAFGTALVLLGTPIYFYYRWKNSRTD